MPMTQKEKSRRYYLKKLALQGKEPKYMRDMVLDEYIKLSNAMKPVLQKEEIKEDKTSYNSLEDKIKNLEEKIKNASANPVIIPSAPSTLPEYEELKSLNREISEVKKIFSTVRYDPSDYEKQLLQVYDTKHLYNSKRADLNDLETLNYIIGIKKILLDYFLKLKKRYNL